MSTKANYLTIKTNGSSELVIKKSRFIAHFARTQTTEEAKDFIALISKKHHDASHNTYAYTIGLNDNQVKASDNGEPSGTAGVPELRTLQMMKLKNVTVVVTRYFGGIKLGAGGLIRAYSASVSQGAKRIGIVKRVLQQELSFSVPYHRYDQINHYLIKNSINTPQRRYQQDVTLSVFLDEKDVRDFKNKIKSLLAGRVSFKEGQKAYREILLAK